METKTCSAAGCLAPRKTYTNRRPAMFCVAHESIRTAGYQARLVVDPSTGETVKYTTLRARLAARGGGPSARGAALSGEVRAAREAAGLPVEAVALVAGMTAGEWASYESGGRRMTERQRDRMAGAVASLAGALKETP